MAGSGSQALDKGTRVMRASPLVRANFTQFQPIFKELLPRNQCGSTRRRFPCVTPSVPCETKESVVIASTKHRRVSAGAERIREDSR